jgi:hypothetical protein
MTVIMDGNVPAGVWPARGASGSGPDQSEC